jgi:hypothetical protein
MPKRKIEVPKKRGVEKIEVKPTKIGPKTELGSKSKLKSKASDDWPQKTIRMEKKLFNMIGNVAESLGMKDHEFCTMALTNEVKRHNKKAQESLLKKIEELRNLELETMESSPN